MYIFVNWLFNFMSETINTNICIIGAGPAGATTSLFLSKMKISHTIVDAAFFPRDKVCGDGLDLKVLRVLNQLDPSIVENEIMHNPNFVHAKGCSIIVSKNKSYAFRVKNASGNGNGYPLFFISKRSHFDNFLVSKINPQYADFRQGAAVKKIERKTDGWQISAEGDNKTIEIKAKLIVGADGDHSAMLRFLGERKIERRNYAAALRQYWKGIEGITEDKHLEIYLPKTLPLAYLWIFPLPDGEANVGWGLASDQVAAKSINLQKVFNQLITEEPALKDRFKNAQPLDKPMGWGLPLASQGRKASGDGYLLTGDAASLVNPTTGEGIGTGMFSGYIAAHYIQRAVQENRYDKAMFTTYDREINRRLKGDVKKYNFVRKLSPFLYKALLSMVSFTGISRYFFNRSVNKWVHTAKHKPIDINM